MIVIFLLCFSFLFVAGCATTKAPYSSSETTVIPSKGVYHKVTKGETLWRIAKTYQVSLEDITTANNIPNAASIELNQLLFIPGVDVIKKIEIPSATSTQTAIIDGDADFIWPVRGGRVVSFFGDRKGSAQNQGIDIKVSDDLSVRASRSGKVVLVNYLVGYGMVVVLEHHDGLLSVYGHNEKVFVKLGDVVTKETMIAKAKIARDQAYIHFAVRRGHKAQNPLYYLPRE